MTTEYADISTGELLREFEVRDRALPKALPSVENWDNERLVQYGVEIIDVIEVEPPEVEPPFQVQANGYEKDGGIWTQVWDIIEPPLEVAKQYQSWVIMQAYEQVKLTSVSAQGHDWKGGFSSAQGIEGVARMIEELGGTDVVLQPVGEEPITVNIAKAKLIAIAVAQAYQPIYMQKETRLRAIDAAETAAEALAVTWDDPS